MLKKNILFKTLVLLLGLFFALRYAGLSLLKLYVESGMGSCKKIPIFCVTPQETVIALDTDENYLLGLPCSELKEIQICTPKEFKLIRQRLTKVYRESKKYRTRAPSIYLLYEEPGFFINLFPQIKKQGITDDYLFIDRLMQARMDEIHNLTDAFFVIMKGVFTPDLGDQSNVRIIKFTSRNFRGFVSYTIGASENYFDCNIIDADRNFFKVYIKDTAKVLDLAKVFMIISTLRKAG